MRKRFRVCVLALSLAIGFPAVAFSQALPVDPIAKVIAGAANESYFFKAADFAKQQVTLTKMSESAMRAAANAPAIGGGVSWLSNLKYLGRTSLPGIAIGLAADAAISWYFADEPVYIPPGEEPDPDNPQPEPLPVDSVKIPAPPNVANPPSLDYKDPVTGMMLPRPNGTEFYLQGRLRYGQPAFRVGYNSNKETWYIHAMSAASAVAFAVANQDIWLGITNLRCFWSPDSLGRYECRGNATAGPNSGPHAGQYLEDAQIVVASFLPKGEADCGGGMMYLGQYNQMGRCLGDPSPVPGGYDTVQTLESASASVPESELAKDANPLLLSQLANQLWLDAASQPGYEGVPHPGYDAVSQWDVQNYLNEHPELWPTVEDLLKAFPRDETGRWTIPSGTTSPNPDPDPNPNPGGNVDLGPDPGIPAPELESIPTAQMIIDPLTQLFPDLKNYQVNMPVGECPRPSFEVFGNSFTVSSHCDLLDQNQNVIQLFMMAAFGILSLLIVLRA